MLHSDKFQETTIIIDGKEYKMEYDVSQAMEKSIRGFGNIYIDEEEPMQFTFFTIDNKIAAYTPMNGTKDFISNIVETATGHKFPFSDL